MVRVLGAVISDPSQLMDKVVTKTKLSDDALLGAYRRVYTLSPTPSWTKVHDQSISYPTSKPSTPQVSITVSASNFPQFSIAPQVCDIVMYLLVGFGPGWGLSATTCFLNIHKNNNMLYASQRSGYGDRMTVANSFITVNVGDVIGIYCWTAAAVSGRLYVAYIYLPYNVMPRVNGYIGEMFINPSVSPDAPDSAAPYDLVNYATNNLEVYSQDRLLGSINTLTRFTGLWPITYCMKLPKQLGIWAWYDAPSASAGHYERFYYPSSLEVVED